MSNLFNDNRSQSNQPEDTSNNPQLEQEDTELDDLLDDEEDEEDEEEDDYSDNADIDPRTQFVLEYNLETLIINKADFPGSLINVANRNSDALGLPQDLTRLRFRKGDQYLDETVEPEVGSVYTLSVGHNRKGM